jgi:hypothetical protein
MRKGRKRTIQKRKTKEEKTEGKEKLPHHTVPGNCKC